MAVLFTLWHLNIKLLLKTLDSISELNVITFRPIPFTLNPKPTYYLKLTTF